MSNSIILKRTRWSIILLWILLSITHNRLLAQSFAASCPPDRKQPDHIEMILSNKLTWGVFMQLTKTGYAGDDENPRPIPDWSFADMKRMSEKSWSRIRDTMIFAFELDRLKHEFNDIIPIKKSKFWCIVRAGDMVLFSDRITHHYTTIQSVDRKKQLVYLQDQWPDKIFLRKGYNQAGVAAKIDGSVVSITKDEFIRVVIGLLTPDTQEFIDYYLNNNPTAASDPKITFALSSTLLEDGLPKHVYRSVSYFRKTLELIDPKIQQTLYYKTAQRLAFALARSSYLQYRDGNVLRANQYSDELNTLFSKISADKLEPYYSSDDYFKLANLAGTADDFQMAILYFTEAIRITPKFSDAYLYRALAKNKAGDYTGAVSDATRAIELIDLDIAKADDALAEKDRLGWIQTGQKKGEKRLLTKHKIEALTVRSEAFFTLGKKQESFNDAMVVKRLEQIQAE